MKTHFHMKGLCTKTRFEKEAQDKSEMAYSDMNSDWPDFCGEYFQAVRLVQCKCGAEGQSGL